jgi:hypothetical protein
MNCNNVYFEWPSSEDVAEVMDVLDEIENPMMIWQLSLV